MAGIGSSIVSLFVIWLAFPTWGLIVYPELATFPEWAQNMTLGAQAIKAVVPMLPVNGTAQFLANVTNALVNGTVH